MVEKKKEVKKERKLVRVSYRWLDYHFVVSSVNIDELRKMFKGKLALKIGRLYNYLIIEAENFRKQKLEIAKKYAELDDNNEMKKIRSAQGIVPVFKDREGYEQEMSEILNDYIDLNMYRIQLTDEEIEKLPELSVVLGAFLDPLFDYDDQDEILKEVES